MPAAASAGVVIWDAEGPVQGCNRTGGPGAVPCQGGWKRRLPALEGLGAAVPVR